MGLDQIIVALTLIVRDLRFFYFALSKAMNLISDMLMCSLNWRWESNAGRRSERSNHLLAFALLFHTIMHWAWQQRESAGPTDINNMLLYS